MALMRVLGLGRKKVRPTVLVETMRFAAKCLVDAVVVANPDDVVDEHVQVVVALLHKDPRMRHVSVHVLRVARLNIAVMHANALIIEPESGDGFGGGVVESDVGLVFAGQGMERSANRVDGQSVRLHGEARFVDVDGERSRRGIVQFAVNRGWYKLNGSGGGEAFDGDVKEIAEPSDELESPTGTSEDDHLVPGRQHLAEETVLVFVAPTYLHIEFGFVYEAYVDEWRFLFNTV